jgi:hypothetical protein
MLLRVAVKMSLAGNISQALAGVAASMLRIQGWSRAHGRRRCSPRRRDGLVMLAASAGISVAMCVSG